jgi:hypothetical protein
MISRCCQATSNRNTRPEKDSQQNIERNCSHRRHRAGKTRAFLQGARLTGPNVNVKHFCLLQIEQKQPSMLVFLPTHTVYPCITVLVLIPTGLFLVQVTRSPGQSH